MSAVCVLTPVVIASWPAISAAVTAAAASMGFSLLGPSLHKEQAAGKRMVETTVENSEVVADDLAPGTKIRIQKDDVTVELGQDQRGRCTVCVTGERQSDRELRRIGAEVAGRIVQQFTYNKLLTELKGRDFTVVGEEMLADQSVKVRVRL
jgi:hypothetical protein